MHLLSFLWQELLPVGCQVAKAKFLQIPPGDDFVKFDECNLQFNEIQFLNACVVAVKVR